MSRLYLIRHGHPALAWGQTGEADPGLDVIGQEQARNAMLALMALPSERQPTRVVSSPMRRCVDTALPLAHRLGLKVEIEPRVGEIPTPQALSLGERPAWLKTAMAGRWSEIQGDLDYEQWRRRAVRAVQESWGAAVFSHYVAINAICSAIKGREDVLFFRPDHASITVLEPGPSGPVIVELGREASTRVL